MSRERARAALDKAWAAEKPLSDNKFMSKLEVERVEQRVRIYLDLAKAEMMEREPQDFSGPRAYSDGWPPSPGSTPC